MAFMKLEGNAESLLFVGFNQDYQRFVCGTTTGFIVFNSDPFKELHRRVFANGGIGYVELLFLSHIMALVGGGINPRYPPNKVVIWNDNKNKCERQLSFLSEVKSVKLKRDRLVVALEDKIYVYDLNTLAVLDRIETKANVKGLCAICPDSRSSVLVCPGLEKGCSRVELYDIKKRNIIQGHDSSLRCFALSYDGKLLATASENGTLVRVWDTVTGEKLQELRRGADHADIQCLCFSKTSKYLAVSSDKGTIHLFNVRNENVLIGNGKQSKKTHNTKTSLGMFKKMLPSYFSSEWSFAQLRVPDAKTIVAFDHDETCLIVVSADGTFYKAKIQTKDGYGSGCGKAQSQTFVKTTKMCDD